MNVRNQRKVLGTTVQSSCMIDHRLRVLRIVAERGTIGAAAADLGYTPSAVSHQLRTLARDVGVVLLEPDGRRVRLTAAARVLVSRSDRLFASWESIRGEVQRASGQGLGHLRLAGFSTAASTLLPAVVAAARAAFPYAELKIIEADPDVCFDLLLTEKVDVAVVVVTDDGQLPAPDDPRFEQHPLLEDALDLLVPADHPLAGRGDVRLSEAAREDWILDRPGRPYHRLVTSACYDAGFTPRQVHEIVEWDTGAQLVAAGLGVALVPRLARLPADELISRVRLTGDDAPVRRVATCLRRGSADQPEIALAVDVLQETAARLEERSLTGVAGSPR